MIKHFIQKSKKKKGFTLIELIVVVTIIAILAALAIPKLMGTQESAKRRTDKANAKLIHDGAAKLMTEGTLNVTTDKTLNITATPVTGDETTLNNSLQTHPVPKYKGHTSFVVQIKGTSAEKDITVYVDSVGTTNQVYPQPATGDYATD